MPLEVEETGIEVAGTPATPTPGASPGQSRASALVSATVQRVLQALRLRGAR